MYKKCCKKCGSTTLHTEPKGNNVGLYCGDCGAWIKWLGKEEVRAFEHSKEEAENDEMHTSDEVKKLRIENAELKRLLKLAVNDIQTLLLGVCDNCFLVCDNYSEWKCECKGISAEECRTNCKWRYADEVNKLFNKCNDKKEN